MTLFINSFYSKYRRKREVSKSYLLVWITWNCRVFLSSVAWCIHFSFWKIFLLIIESLSDPLVHLLTCVFSIQSLLGDWVCELTDKLLLQIFLSPLYSQKVVAQCRLKVQFQLLGIVPEHNGEWSEIVAWHTSSWSLTTTRAVKELEAKLHAIQKECLDFIGIEEFSKERAKPELGIMDGNLRDPFLINVWHFLSNTETCCLVPVLGKWKYEQYRDRWFTGAFQRPLRPSFTPQDGLCLVPVKNSSHGTGWWEVIIPFLVMLPSWMWSEHNSTFFAGVPRHLCRQYL